MTVKKTTRKRRTRKNKRPAILDALENEYSFTVFDGNADYDLNIIGVRSLNTEAGRYDDQLVICYKAKGVWKEERFQCTCDPSYYWLKNATMRGGTAIIKHPQQMRGAYSIGLHRGKYECLKQTKAVDYWRDASKDRTLDYSGTVYRGVIGVNIHRSSAWRDTSEEAIGQYSAGCTVLSSPESMARVLFLCKKQIEVNNWQRFTYTLIRGDY